MPWGCCWCWWCHWWCWWCRWWCWWWFLWRLSSHLRHPPTDCTRRAAGGDRLACTPKKNLYNGGLHKFAGCVVKAWRALESPPRVCDQARLSWNLSTIILIIIIEPPIVILHPPGTRSRPNQPRIFVSYPQIQIRYCPVFCELSSSRMGGRTLRNFMQSN